MIIEMLTRNQLHMVIGACSARLEFLDEEEKKKYKTISDFVESVTPEWIYENYPNYIESVKFVRDNTGCGLVDAVMAMKNHPNRVV